MENIENSKEWFEIEGFPNYIINIHGDVFNRKKSKMITATVSKRYKTVSLINDKFGRKNYFLHRIYAQTFIPNPENKPLVMFMSNDKMNISVDNLKWMTQKEKCHYLESIGKVDYAANRRKALIASNKTTSIPINFIDEDGNSTYYPSASACARAQGMTLWQVLKNMS